MREADGSIVELHLRFTDGGPYEVQHGIVPCEFRYAKDSDRSKTLVDHIAAGDNTSEAFLPDRYRSARHHSN